MVMVTLMVKVMVELMVMVMVKLMVKLMVIVMVKLMVFLTYLYHAELTSENFTRKAADNKIVTTPNVREM